MSKSPNSTSSIYDTQSAVLSTHEPRYSISSHTCQLKANHAVETTNDSPSTSKSSTATTTRSKKTTHKKPHTHTPRDKNHQKVNHQLIRRPQGQSRLQLLIHVPPLSTPSSPSALDQAPAGGAPRLPFARPRPPTASTAPLAQRIASGTARCPSGRAASVRAVEDITTSKATPARWPVSGRQCFGTSQKLRMCNGGHICSFYYEKIFTRVRVRSGRRRAAAAEQTNAGNDHETRLSRPLPSSPICA